MGASILRLLLGVALSVSAGILTVELVKRPTRAAFGARAAYWLWLLVPAIALAALLPAPARVLHVSTHALTQRFGSALATIAVAQDIFGPSSMQSVATLVVWGAGVFATFALLLGRHRSFVRSLGPLLPDSMGTQRSAAIVTPMLIGACYPKLVLPADFEQRYSDAERELILAHEMAHLSRRDGAINAIATGSLCVFWFNPLMYWAIGRLRLDQELACDASVLAGRSGAARRSYADALLKTQLAAQSGWRMPIGCHWQSIHPLKERIAMLKCPMPGLSRHLAGVALAIVLTVAGSYAAWAAQSAPNDTGKPILVNLSLTITSPHADNPKAVDINEISTEYVVNSGEAPPLPRGGRFDMRCTPTLPYESGASSAPTEALARGIPRPAAGQIVLQCEFGQNGKVASTPTLIALDGHTATVEIDDQERDRAVHYRLKVTAWASAEAIEAAKAASHH